MPYKPLDNRQYYIYEDITRIAALQQNPMDEAMILLIAAGVRGENCYDLIHLREADYHAKRGLLHVTDSKGSTRYVKLDEPTQDAIRRMRESTVYHVSDRIDTGYQASEQLFKPLVPYKRNGREPKDETHVSEQFIMRVLKRINDQHNLKRFTALNIERAGLITHYIEAIEAKNGKPLTKQNIEDVVDLTDHELSNRIGIPYNLKPRYNETGNLYDVLYDVTQKRTSLLNRDTLRTIID